MAVSFVFINSFSNFLRKKLNVRILISGFGRDVDEIYALLGYYATLYPRTAQISTLIIDSAASSGGQVKLTYLIFFLGPPLESGLLI
jgi:hypothetical protein